MRRTFRRALDGIDALTDQLANVSGSIANGSVHKLGPLARAEVGKSVNPISCFRVSRHTPEAAAR